MFECKPISNSDNVKIGTITLPKSHTNNRIELGWRPSYFSIWSETDANQRTYNSTVSTTRFVQWGSSSGSWMNISTSNTGNCTLRVIDDTGVNVAGDANTRTWKYIAIK